MIDWQHLLVVVVSTAYAGRTGLSVSAGSAGTARFVAREGWVVQAYRYAPDPSPRQERALASHAGAARVAYNWAVTWVLATWA